jgi:translation initiation factor eIF-2B subunit alpha
MKFVAALGTANIISLCHLQQLSVYLFATTLKFSHQRSSEQKIHRKEELRRQENCDYVLITHSHDIVDMDLVDYIVTENGVHTVAELEKVIQSRDQ